MAEIEQTDELGGYVTTSRAADLLGIKRDRVLQLIRAGRLAAKKMEGIYLVDLASVQARQRDKVGAGRPRKKAEASA